MSGEGELVALLRELVGTASPSGAEAAVQQCVAAWFAAAGIESRREPAADGLANLVVELEGTGAGPTLWIGGHCDTVGVASGWTQPPREARIEGNRLYGLGAFDMKGGLAAAMLTVRDLAARRADWHGRLIFAALADEEAYSRGAEAFARTDRHIDAALMCEPHFAEIVTGAMGKVNLQVEVIGRSAHASHPEQGINAVTEAARLIVAIGALERPPHPVHGRPTQCVLDVASGDGSYEIRVPERCHFRVNWHLMPGETPQDALATAQRLVEALYSPAHFEIALGEPRYESYELPPDTPLLLMLQESCRALLGHTPRPAFGHGVSDANILAGRLGIPTLLFGPGGANMHAGDEWVDLVQLQAVRTVYRDVALRFLGGRTGDDPNTMKTTS